MIVKILIGHICAGKSTYSIDLVNKKNYIRLSMDDLKIMMCNKIVCDKKTDDLVAATLEQILQLVANNESRDVVIDGFPLDIESLTYLASCYDVEINVFTIDLFKANLRNRKRYEEDGIFIEPEEIKEYNTAFDKFINTERFHKLTRNAKVNYLENYEKKLLLI